ncbi:hypothetical protein ABNIH10_07296, partial [Acinetobacter baumannii ABNIH10]
LNTPRFLKMSTIKKSRDESEIPSMAGQVLRASFLEVSRYASVLYAKDGAVLKQTPNGRTVTIKQLPKRDHELAQRVLSQGTVKLKKRKVEEAE